MCKIEIIDNRNISAVYHAGDLNQLIKRSSVIHESLSQIAKRDRDTFHTGYRVIAEYRVDPSYDDYEDECKTIVARMQRAYKRIATHGIEYRAAVIIMHNYAIEFVVADE